MHATLLILASCLENERIYERLVFYTVLERITPNNRGCRAFGPALPRLHPLLKRITRLAEAYYDFADNASSESSDGFLLYTTAYCTMELWRLIMYATSFQFALLSLATRRMPEFPKTERRANYCHRVYKESR